MAERAALRYILPWLKDYVRETQALMGKQKWWQDGFTPNRHILDKFLKYSHKQGLASKKLKPEELFAPNTLKTFVV